MRPLPRGFVATRESLRAVACYVISPFRKERTGRIGLRPTGDGFGTPPFDDGSRVVVRGDLLALEPGTPVHIATLRGAAAHLGVELSADPGVGDDLPPFEPDTPLFVDETASLALGAWYGFGQSALDAVGGRLPAGATVTEAQLWPEHFDLAVVVTLAGDRGVNVGFSPGDTAVEEPYVYVGPHDLSGLDGGYWNAPFGAVLRRSEIRGDGDAALRQAVDFVARGLAQL